MIKVTRMQYGWLTLHINERAFGVSYLSAFKEEMDDLLNLPYDNMTVNRILLDGEGIDLYLTAWRLFDILVIVWEVATDIPRIDTMIFDYNEFMKDYKVMWDEIKDNYQRDFLMEDADKK